MWGAYSGQSSSNECLDYNPVLPWLLTYSPQITTVFDIEYIQYTK